jgi:hypothetical protein
MRAAIFGVFAVATGLSAIAAGQGGSAPAPASTEETPQYQTPAASRFQFAWDALIRYDAIELDRQAPLPNIYRWRTEVRPEIDWIASDRFRLGVRLVGDLGSDSNSTNAARFDNYRSNGIALDRAISKRGRVPLFLTPGVPDADARDGNSGSRRAGHRRRGGPAPGGGASSW